MPETIELKPGLDMISPKSIVFACEGRNRGNEGFLGRGHGVGRCRRMKRMILSDFERARGREE
jgi:hypothetical protein